jgi:hypothetical protein
VVQRGDFLWASGPKSGRPSGVEELGGCFDISTDDMILNAADIKFGSPFHLAKVLPLDLRWAGRGTAAHSGEAVVISES